MNWEIISKIIGGIFLVMIISIFNIIVYVLSEPEEHFIEAVKRTWNEKPILDISTTKIDDDYYEYPLFNLTNSNTFCDCIFIYDKKSPFYDHCPPKLKI